MHNFLIAYDIFNPKRLRKIRKIVSSYMLGGQKSALEVPLNKNSLKCLVSDLNYFTEEEDKINIICIEAKNIDIENNSIIII